MDIAYKMEMRVEGRTPIHMFERMASTLHEAMKRAPDMPAGGHDFECGVKWDGETLTLQGEIFPWPVAG